MLVFLSIAFAHARNYDILGRFNGCYSRLTPWLRVAADLASSPTPDNPLGKLARQSARRAADLLSQPACAPFVLDCHPLWSTGGLLCYSIEGHVFLDLSCPCRTRESCPPTPVHGSMRLIHLAPGALAPAAALTQPQPRSTCRRRF